MLRDSSRASGLLYKSAAAFLRAHVDGVSPEIAARGLYGREHSLDPILKAASSPATLTDPNWAGPAVQNLIRGDLIQSITALSAGAALMESCTRVDLTGLASITVPGRLYNPASAGAWVAEGAPVPVRNPQLTQGPKLQPRKLVVLTGYTREMVESSAIEAFTRMAITESTAALVDQQMFSTNAGDATKPAGILTGATTVTPSTATSAWAISSDIGALVQALAQHGGGLVPVIVAAPAQAAALRMWRQQDFYDIYASAALTAGTVVAVESTSFVSALGGAPRFEVGDSMAIHEEDSAPTDIVTGGVLATPTKSYFQIDSIGLRMTLMVTWGLRNPAHVAIVTGVSW
jgi:hypothetical protein